MTEKIAQAPEKTAQKPRRFESVSASSMSAADVKIHEGVEFRQCSGVLEIITDPETGSVRYGFLRDPASNFCASNTDIYVSPGLIKTCKLRNGDFVVGDMRHGVGNDKYNSLAKVVTINDEAVDIVLGRIPFEGLTAVFPDKQIKLETAPTIFSTRIIDLFAPIGFGQRGMIVAPPKSGKTVLLKEIANGISANCPEVRLFILLIGERPEEVTDMARGVRGEVFASTFDETADRQVKISMFALEKAKRLVEKGENVVVLMDSITRFARACNVISSETSRILSGGLSVNALFYPKKFFGAARNIENGGSLTIIATALVETGSKMDDVIFEEFKGTGNMELQLDRNLTYKNIYPAINILSSGTRRDDLLLDKRYFNKVQILKKLLADPTQNEPTEFLINKMRMTRSNEEFLKLMGGI